ncbi:MAG: helix-turn-helix domain-containing protein [Candidatus Bathyarchaeia archaeon]|jgi:DNA-binding IclR family transcriptional regulator
MKTLDELLGPSKYLKVLDIFLQNPEELMNLREIARRLNKNPGSVTPILPVLVNKGYISHSKVGIKIVAYQLNKDNNIIKRVQRLLHSLEE